MAFGIIPFNAPGQSGRDRDRIAASQAGASPIYFDTHSIEIPLIQPGDFYSELECEIRSGLPNFITKANKGETIVVAFIGGSITQANFGYRLQAARYLETRYPKASFKWINAGVSGTGTELGAFRIREQVLQYQPDLVFIEFAVNGAYPDGMEGMIRQTISNNPSTEICLLYTILTGQTSFYQKSQIPDHIKGLEKIADYYGLPSIQLAVEAASLEGGGRLIWKTGGRLYKDKIMFSDDGIHPTTAGGNLYAAAIARSFLKMESIPEGRNHQLRAPLLTASWDKATMLKPADVIRSSEGWRSEPIVRYPHLKKFEGWFSSIYTASAPGAFFRFNFEGDMMGVFDVGGPEVGQLEWFVDGKPVQLTKSKQGAFTCYQAQIVDTPEATPLNRFNAYCNNRYRGQFDVIRLKEGKHSVEVRVSARKSDKLQILPSDKREDIQEHPKKYDQSVIYLGRILIRGKWVE